MNCPYCNQPLLDYAFIMIRGIDQPILKTFELLPDGSDSDAEPITFVIVERKEQDEPLPVRE